MYVHSWLSTRKQGLTPDKEVFEGYMAELSVKLEVYDKILSKQKYLLGDVRQFLLADTSTLLIRFPYRKFLLSTFFISP